MPDVFISYSRTDKGQVHPLAVLLTELGLSVWWDANLEAGTDFDNEISRQIHLSRSVIVVWSKNSIESRWVKGEAREAADQGKLIPIRIDGSPTPLDFRSVHTLDLSNWDGGTEHPEVGALLSAIESKQQRKLDTALRREADGNRVLRKKLRRQRWVLAGVGCLMLGLSVASFRTLREAANLVIDAYQVAISDSVLPASLQAGVETIALPARRIAAAKLDALLTEVGDLRLKPEGLRGSPSVWNAGQYSMANPANAESRKAEILRYFDDSIDGTCACWNWIDGSKHSVSTAWVLMSHALMTSKAREPTVEAILQSQDRQGWWPLDFDASPNAKFASTNATAYLTMSLHSVYESPQTDAELKLRIAAAIERSLSWLYSQLPKPGARWVDYPRSEERQIQSRGISALVTYVFLVSTRDNRSAAVLSHFMASLEMPPDFDAIESSDQYYLLKNGRQRRDGTRYVVWGWEVAVLLQAYSRLGWADKVSARNYLRKATTGNPLTPRSMQVDWLITETAAALRMAGAASSR